MAGIDSILLNRALGLGTAGPAEGDATEQIATAYAGAGVTRHLVHLAGDAEPAGLAERLAAAGYRPYRAWVPFARDATLPPLDAPTDLAVVEAGPADAEAWAAIVAPAFDLGAEAEPLLAGLADDPAWTLYLTVDGDEPAGAAALFVHEGAGWGDWAATRPEFRKRGGQSALLARIVADAATAGCDVVLGETGEAVPGDPQHSYHNVVRAGFEPGPPRANWIFER